MEKIVFTNGCFDILHPGHVDLLRRAKALGTKLVVGINSDRSVRAIKGEGRPFLSQEERREVLLGLASVDEVLIFDELTPETLIRNLKPDVLVKGGDWPTEQIIGADLVLADGGRVHSLPLLNGYSSSAIVDRIRGSHASPAGGTNGGSAIEAALTQHQGVFTRLLETQTEAINECANLIISTVMAGKKILVCGNGGSAADAQHIAAELVGRYETDRAALPSIALTTDTSALTAVSNDFGFENVFARQVEGLAAAGDCLIAISTSGESKNILAAVMAARKRSCKVIGLTGASGKRLASLADASVMVPSERTARIQEAHIAIAHIWCEMVDTEVSRKKTVER